MKRSTENSIEFFDCSHKQQCQCGYFELENGLEKRHIYPPLVGAANQIWLSNQEYTDPVYVNNAFGKVKFTKNNKKADVC